MEPHLHPVPAPPELGTLDGLSYALFLPESEPVAGVVILHGAGSAKESHFDFARGCREDGIAALAYDARGHGSSDGRFGPGAIDDALAMVELLREHAPRVALRGSSMGGFQAIHAGARDPSVCAVVAICPAPEDGLLRFLRSGQPLEFECDAEACGPWLESLDLGEAAASLGPETALLLMHARGDEQVPHAVSEQLYEVAREPKRLLLTPGGHHRSVQHDLELQAASRKFIRDAAQRSAPPAT
jgi:alpha-beta hydrolase superfamily lysophospholipase